MDRYRYIHIKIEECHDSYNHSTIFVYSYISVVITALVINHCSSLRFTGNCYMFKAVEKNLIILARL